MDKKKIELIITLLLVFGLVIAVINGIKTIAQKKASVSKYGNYVASKPEIIINKNVKAEIPAQAMADQKSTQQGDIISQGILIRDPFSRDSKLVAKESETKIESAPAILTGIVYDKENPQQSYCIVNGEIVKQGEAISSFIITKIDETSVVVTSQDKTQEYRLSVWNE